MSVSFFLLLLEQIVPKIENLQVDKIPYGGIMNTDGEFI